MEQRPAPDMTAVPWRRVRQLYEAGELSAEVEAPTEPAGGGRAQFKRQAQKYGPHGRDPAAPRRPTQTQTQTQPRPDQTSPAQLSGGAPSSEKLPVPRLSGDHGDDNDVSAESLAGFPCHS